MATPLSDALQARRARVDDALAGCFQGLEPQALREAAAWYPEAGGKRLRPVMALLACEAAGGPPQAALPVALAVELVHNFSLVHDDIMDHDDVRRGRETVHRKWDEATAILAGDVLFARAFEVLGGIEDAEAHREASVVLSRAVRRLCEGQAMDVAFERREDVGVAEYLEMIRGKTAMLFEAACRGGALCAITWRRRDEAAAPSDGSSPRRTPDAVDALSTYGDAFGVAFQIADDILDVVATSETLGKPWGSDIRAGKRTILVLDALENGDAKEKDALLDALGDPDASDAAVRRAVDALRTSGALGRAEALRDEHAGRARDALQRLPPGEAREILAELNEWARIRGF